MANPEHVPRNVHRETGNCRGAQRRGKQSTSTKLTYHVAAQPQVTERLFRTLERVDYPWEPAERDTDKDQDDEDDQTVLIQASKDSFSLGHNTLPLVVTGGSSNYACRRGS